MSNTVTALNITWRGDVNAKPKSKPNPAYPEGIDVDASTPGQPFCKTSLPYPAQGIGGFLIECRLCGLRTAVSTAGRPDDPRSVKLTCRKMGRA